LTGDIHEYGTNPHDSVTVNGWGETQYSNLQNGDGCGLAGWDIFSGYAVVPFFYEINQPDFCLVDGEGICSRHIEDCKNCPLRAKKVDSLKAKIKYFTSWRDEEDEEEEKPKKKRKKKEEAPKKGGIIHSKII
jgi:hypothetical protein